MLDIDAIEARIRRQCPRWFRYKARDRGDGRTVHVSIFDRNWQREIAGISVETPAGHWQTDHQSWKGIDE